MTELTHEELARILDYDPETGVFRWKVSGGRQKIGNVAGCKNKNANRTRIKGKSYLLRRLAWFYSYKQWPERNLFTKELGQFNDSIKNIGMLPKKPKTLTHEYLKECIDYNPETGEWKWKITEGKANFGAFAYKSGNRAIITAILGKEYTTNRLIWFYMTGELPGKGNLVLTKNNIMTDLRWDNLVIGSANDACQKRKVVSKTGFKGVAFDKANKKYKAQIQHSGKKINLGYFPTPEEAHEAYMKAASEHFGELHHDGYQHVSFQD